MKKIECKKCGELMPKARLDLYGYKNCIKCSDVIPYGHVHIVEGKTADTIQILPGDVAERANRYAQRNNFGVSTMMIED